MASVLLNSLRHQKPVEHQDKKKKIIKFSAEIRTEMPSNYLMANTFSVRCLNYLPSLLQETKPNSVIFYPCLS